MYTKSKIEIFCNVLNTLVYATVIDEHRVEKAGLIYDKVKCECGGVHDAVSLTGSNK